MLSQYANHCAFAVCKSLCFCSMQIVVLLQYANRCVSQYANPLYSNYRNSIYRAKVRNFFLTTKSRRIFLEKGDIIWLNVLSNNKCNFPAK